MGRPKLNLDYILNTTFNKRFRGFYPVVIDVETGGFKAEKDALLELAAVFLGLKEDNTLGIVSEIQWHIKPFKGANLDPEALAFNKIDPDHPFRLAVSENQALTELMDLVRAGLKENQCHRAVLVGHNSWFDLSFLNAAIARVELKKNPFHAFTSLDTASIGAVFLGHTVLSTLLKRAGLSYNAKEAHNALYDARCTAELFCYMLNLWDNLSEDHNGSIE
jgi:ribonuclease T